MEILKNLEKYIDNLKQIRALSSPSLNGIFDETGYSRQLSENFVRIGHLAEENREILEEYLFPICRSDKALDEAELKLLTYFEEQLLDAVNAENLDIPIVYIVSERLLNDALSKGDILQSIRRMDMQISTCYTLMNMTGRIAGYPELAERYRREGISTGEVFLDLREKKRFQRLESDKAKELVLINARFMECFYEQSVGEREYNEKSLELLRRSLEINEDPFYTDLMPDYDWRYDRYRTLTYYSQSTDYSNCRKFTDEQLEEIWERTEELWTLWHTDPEYFSELEKESYIKFHLIRNRYYAGKISREECTESLVQLYHERDKNLYDFCGIIENIQLPSEIIRLIWKDELTIEDLDLLLLITNNVLAYTFHMPNSGVLSFMLEMVMHIMESYAEIPGGIDFENLMLNLFAAMHPPTYVHAQMVAEISVCLCRHLIETHPEFLIGVEGCGSAEDVVKNKEAVTDFTRHAALCHDTGKLCIIDTVFVYGRKLLDLEFELIKTHPGMGAMMLGKYESTKKYVDVALGHHKWYDDSRGYPEEFVTHKSPVKGVIDLVQCADGLDAASDSVGRSYNRGKTYDEYIEEVREGSGSRYAPWLYELLSRPEVKKDIESILSEGREKHYRYTYRLLKSVQDNENQ